ncbi:hypothetical protein NMY22_g20131 [Coprinellus aureogranulatus]|nr:hypothetical protein NMY22_g20131 [Coprinellus aureogranulatus]
MGRVTVRLFLKFHLEISIVLTNEHFPFPFPLDPETTSTARIHSDRHPSIRISDDRDLRPPDPPPHPSTVDSTMRMDVDGVVDSPIDFSDEIPIPVRPIGGKEKEEKVEEEYMPPKMRKKLRSRMLEELKRIVGKGSIAAVSSDGDGQQAVDSQNPPSQSSQGLPPPEVPQPRPPTSASPSASFAKLSLFTPLPRPTNPIDVSTSSSPQRLPPRGQSSSPTPSLRSSPAKGERSRIPLSDVRGEPAPPLPTRRMSTTERRMSAATKPEKTTVKRNAQSTGSPPSSPREERGDPSQRPPGSPRQPLPSSPSKSESEAKEKEREKEEREEGAMDVDGKETEVIPDTPLSPPPSTRASTTASTPPPRPPPHITTALKSSTNMPPKLSPTKETTETVSRASPTREQDVLRLPARSKKMDVHSLVNSEASTPNMVVRRELEVSPPPVSVSQDEDVEMGEVQEDNALSKPVEPTSTSLMVSTSNANPQSISDSKADPLSEETQSKTDAIPAREPTHPPAIPKAPTPPPPPPQKVKLSLKDFAARRKKQKEEEEKHRKEEGGGVPSSTSAPANLASSAPSAPAHAASSTPSSPVNTAPSSSLTTSALNGAPLSSSANGTSGARKEETMTKEVKKEAVQDILMRPSTPEREEGEEVEGEHGIPGRHRPSLPLRRSQPIRCRRAPALLQAYRRHRKR